MSYREHVGRFGQHLITLLLGLSTKHHHHPRSSYSSMSLSTLVTIHYSTSCHSWAVNEASEWFVQGHTANRRDTRSQPFTSAPGPRSPVKQREAWKVSDGGWGAGVGHWVPRTHALSCLSSNPVPWLWLCILGVLCCIHWEGAPKPAAVPAEIRTRYTLFG